MNENGLKKSIVKTAITTFVIMLVLFAIFSTIMLLGFTRQSADFVYSLGLDRMASSLYGRVYEQTGDIVYCYKSLCVKIKLGDNHSIVNTYEKFIADEKSAEFISNIDSKNKTLNIGVLEMSTMLNEGNYLRHKYISALVKLDRVDEAFDLSITDFDNYPTYTLDNQGMYALDIFSGEETYRENFDNATFDKMKDYFDNIYDDFNANKDATDNVTKAELIALGYRIMNVGQDIINVGPVADAEHWNNSNVTSYREKMLEVNDVIKGLL